MPPDQKPSSPRRLTLRCPVCDKPNVDPSEETAPFCSRRCRQIDLGRWLNESYGFPFERRFDDEEDGPPAHVDE